MAFQRVTKDEAIRLSSYFEEHFSSQAVSEMLHQPLQIFELSLLDKKKKSTVLPLLFPSRVLYDLPKTENCFLFSAESNEINTAQYDGTQINILDKILEIIYLLEILFCCKCKEFSSLFSLIAILHL